MVVGVVIHHDDFQLVRWIILIDAALDGAVYPLFFIEARDDDGHPRRVVRVNLHRPVEGSEEVSGQEEGGGNDAVKVQPAVEAEIHHGLRPHHDNGQHDDAQQEGRSPQHVVLPLGGGILGQSVGKFQGAEHFPFFFHHPDASGLQLLDFHFIAFGHGAGGDFKSELGLIPYLRHFFPNGEFHQQAGGADIHRSAFQYAAAAAALKGHVHGIVHQIALARLVLSLVLRVILRLLSLETTPAVMVAALAGSIRHIGQQAAVRLFFVENIRFFFLFLHHS